MIEIHYTVVYINGFYIHQSAGLIAQKCGNAMSFGKYSYQSPLMESYSSARLFLINKRKGESIIEDCVKGNKIHLLIFLFAVFHWAK